MSNVKAQITPLKFNHKSSKFWAMVGAQLAERSLPIPEDLGSNPTISIFIEQLLTV